MTVRLQRPACDAIHRCLLSSAVGSDNLTGISNLAAHVQVIQLMLLDAGRRSGICSATLLTATCGPTSAAFSTPAPGRRYDAGPGRMQCSNQQVAP
jgi:hypothetical protein